MPSTRWHLAVPRWCVHPQCSEAAERHATNCITWGQGVFIYLPGVFKGVDLFVQEVLRAFILLLALDAIAIVEGLAEVAHLHGDDTKGRSTGCQVAYSTPSGHVGRAWRVGLFWLQPRGRVCMPAGRSLTQRELSSA